MDPANYGLPGCCRGPELQIEAFWTSQQTWSTVASMERPILDSVREAARKAILFLPHAVDEMNAPDELITPEEVRDAILAGQVIEDDPEDVRGHSCLMLGRGAGSRPIHVVCSPKADYLAVITVYIPDEDRWQADFKKRNPRS